MTDDILSLIEEIYDVPATEFWYGSSLLSRAKKYKYDEGIVKALAIRHHYLQNKQAGSCHVLRQTIKAIAGPYFNPLWKMLKSDDEEEKYAALYIVAEIGGGWSFQKFLNILRNKLQKQDFSDIEIIILGLGHNIARYYEISDENEPMMEIMDVKTNQIRTIPQKEIAPDIYERTMKDRKEANEYFILPAIQRTGELISILKELPETVFPHGKEELIELLNGFLVAADRYSTSK